jgi:hypothetical protein
VRPTKKLRVAVPDVINALDVVRSEVKRATGFDAMPVFQELDHSDLVIEVNIANATDADPRDLAEVVDRSVTELDVLSTWTENPLPATGALLAPQILLDVIADPLPQPAQRALLDEIPTAQWLPTVEDVAGGDRSYWLMAVPATQADGLSVVALNRRYGYSMRFSSADAQAVHRSLAS